MSELKRVLKDTGTCWINLGDTYASKPVGKFTHSEVLRNRDLSAHESSGQLDKTSCGIKEKSLMGIPSRFYIQCIDDGWRARNFIPWYKANSMPSSIKDRFTNKWEPVFFFAKEKKYYFNLDAVREKLISPEQKPFNIRIRENITGLAQKKLGDKAWTATEEEMQTHDKNGVRKMLKVEGQITQGIHRNRAEGKFDWKQDNTLGSDGKPIPTYKGFNKRWGEGKWQRHFDQDGNCFGCGKHFSKHLVNNRAQGSENREQRQKDDYVWCNPRGKNPGDVFFINPRPFPDAHFATFPPELPEKILKCACPKGGTVLDPFFGSGTVGLVAEQLNKKWIGIELSEEYIEICKKRLAPYNSIRLDEFV